VAGDVVDGGASPSSGSTLVGSQSAAPDPDEPTAEEILAAEKAGLAAMYAGDES
jgi:hypothetical protein